MVCMSKFSVSMVYFFLNQETKKSFKEKLQAIERVCQIIQNTLDQVACLGERIKK